MSSTPKVSRPYPGIRPFQKEEWSIFFGRERMIDAIMNKLADSQFVLLHGTSGCGKSSLIKAGLLPRLEVSHYGVGKSWKTAQMRPGGSPLWNLAEALSRLIEGLSDSETASVDTVRRVRRRLNRGERALASIQEEFGLGQDGNVCLLIDQFEEVFRYAAQIERSEVDMFVSVLRAFHDAPPAGIYAIATMRSDFLGDCSQFIGFAEVVNKTQYLLPRLEERELMDSIQRPAEVFGGSVAPELAVKLIEESRAEVDALPLVQHCLMYLWQQQARQQDDVPEGKKMPIHLDIGAYQGLKETLSKRAEEVLAELSEQSDRAAWCAEHLFRAVVDLDAEGRATRRPMRLSQLEEICRNDREALDACVERFADSDTGFLVLSGDEDPIVDITHESLIRCWDRLSAVDEFEPDGRPIGWLQREQDDARLWRSLLLRAEEEDGLIGGGVLEDRERLVHSLPGPAWAERYGGHWDDVQDLLARSRRAVDEQKLAEEEKARRDRNIMYAAIAGLVIFFGLAATAYRFYLQADENLTLYREVETRNLVEDWRGALQRALRDTEMTADSSDLRAQIGLYFLDSAPFDLDESTRIDRALKQDFEALQTDFRVALDAARPVFETQFAEDEVDGVAVSPDGRYIAAGSDEGQLVLWDVSGGISNPRKIQSEAMRRAHVDQVGQVKFNPSGTQLLSVGYDGAAHIWNVETGEREMTLPATGRNWGADWSADGAWIAAGADGGTARAWQVSGPVPELIEIRTNSELAMGVAFNPDASRLAVAPLKEGIQIHDISGAGEPMRQIGTGEFFSVVWSGDGRYITSGLDNGDLIIWTVDGEELVRISNREAVRGLAFHPDGTYLATGSDAGEARVWSLPEGDLVAELRGHWNDVDSIAWGPDGDWIVTGTDSGFLRIFPFSPVNGGESLTELVERARDEFEDNRTGLHTCMSREKWLTVVRAAAEPEWCLTEDERIDRYVGMIATAPLSEIDDLVERLVEIRAEGEIFERLVSLANDVAARSRSDADTDLSSRYVEAARRMEIARLPGNQVRLAAVDFLNAQDQSQDPEILPLLVMETLSRERWPSGSELGESPLATAAFAQNASLRDKPAGDGQVRGLSIGNGGEVLAAASNDGHVVVVDLTGGAEPSRFESLDGKAANDAGLSADGRYLAAAFLDGRFILADLSAEPALERVLQREVKIPRSVDWSENGRFLATGADDELARVWRITQAGSAELVATLAGHSGGVRDLSLAPDGRRLLTGSNDATARLWDMETRETIAVFPRDAAITSVDFAPEGETLAIGGADNLVEVRQAMTGALLHEIGLSANIDDVAFSSDGAELAIASDSVSVWDVQTGMRRLTLPVRDVTSIAWGEGSDRLYTGARDGTITVWTFDAETLEAGASSSVKRCLTPEERRRLDLPRAQPAWCARFNGNAP